MKRNNIVLAILMVMFISLPLRMIYIVVEKDSFPDVSNSLRRVIVSEQRGEIYDRSMKKLVNRRTETAVVALPSRESAELLKGHISEENYQSLLESIEAGEIFVCPCDYEEESKFLRCAEIGQRYTDDGFCCHVIGYINATDNVGVSGIERSFDSFLKEDKSKLLFQYNRSGNNDFLPGGENRFVSENYTSEKGVRLTIDYDIQRICENAMRLYGIEKGAVVVMSAESGEIRAMASKPQFNQNDISSSLDDENSPFLNRAVSAYSVGSVFKLVVAAAAIEAGKDVFESQCTGSVDIGGTTFSCSGGTAHGKMDLSDAFAYSCNTYFIRLALRLGSEKILQMAENLGFGKSFSLCDGFYTASGNLPQSHSIATDGMLANISFGQGGLLATPLQVASCYSAAVNGGTFIEPKLILSFIGTDGEEKFAEDNRYKYRALSAGNSDKLKNLLVNNFSIGTCVPAKPEGCTAGGKTSTAQTGWIDEKGKEILHSWFSGFVSVGDETYTITVFKEDGVGGSIDCGPVFKEISQRISQIKCE